MNENKVAIFLLCIVAWGLVLVINEYSETHCAESYLFTLYSNCVNIRGELVIKRCIY